MRNLLSVMLAVVVAGALLLFRSHIAVEMREISKLYMDDNQTNLESIARGVYNQETLADKGSIEVNVKEKLLVYDKKTKTLILSDGKELSNPKRYELLTSYEIKNSSVSIFEKDINKPHVQVNKKDRDIRYFEDTKWKTPFMRQYVRVR